MKYVIIFKETLPFKVLSRLDFILVSGNFIDNCIQSDHSVVTLDFNDGQPSKGHGF